MRRQPKRKNWLAVFISAILICGITTYGIIPEMAFAMSNKMGTITKVYRIDISSGYFAGKKAEYYFNIPKEWRDMVSVDRIEIGSSGNGELEHLNFYCLSESGRYKPAFLFGLYIFAKKNWRDDYPFKVIAKNLSYVFAVDYSDIKGFSNKNDQMLFQSIFNDIDTPEKIKKLINFMGDDSEVAENAIYVNSKEISAEAINIDGLMYVPLRAVVNELGYKVYWYPEQSKVEVLRAYNFYDYFIVHADMTEDKRGIKMKLIDGCTYVQTAYFSKIMKKSVEVDENGNVFFTR